MEYFIMDGRAYLDPEKATVILVTDSVDEAILAHREGEYGDVAICVQNKDTGFLEVAWDLCERKDQP